MGAVLSPQVFKGKESPLTLDWDRVRVFDREVGQMFVNMTKTSREAVVRIRLSCRPGAGPRFTSELSVLIGHWPVCCSKC